MDIHLRDDHYYSNDLGVVIGRIWRISKNSFGWTLKERADRSYSASSTKYQGRCNTQSEAFAAVHSAYKGTVTVLTAIPTPKIKFKPIPDGAFKVWEHQQQVVDNLIGLNDSYDPLYDISNTSKAAIEAIIASTKEHIKKSTIKREAEKGNVIDGEVATENDKSSGMLRIQQLKKRSNTSGPFFVKFDDNGFITQEAEFGGGADYKPRTWPAEKCGHAESTTPDCPFCAAGYPLSTLKTST